MDKVVNRHLHHYIGQEVVVMADWKFKNRETPLTMSYHSGTRLPLSGALYDMITRRENPLQVKLIARRFASMGDMEKVKMVEIVGMQPFELNVGNGFWFARNPMTFERFRVDLDADAFDAFTFAVEDINNPKPNQFIKVTFPTSRQLTEIYGYLQGLGVWVHGDDWFDEGLLIDKATI